MLDFKFFNPDNDSKTFFGENMTNALDRKISTGGLLRFAAPTVFSMLLMEIFGIIDGLFVVRLIGTDALSAVNITFPIILLSIALGMMFSSGGSALVAKRLGQKREKTARQNFSLIALSAFVCGTVLAGSGLFFLKPLLYFLGSDDALYGLCYEYARIALMFTPVTIFACVFFMFYIARGKAGLGMAVTAAAGLTNAVLDYVFIAKCGMGLKGAALATGIGYSATGLFGLLYFLLNRRGSLYLEKPAWSRYVLFKTCFNGASEMVSNVSVCIVTVLLNNIVMRLAGADGVAAITVVLYMQTSLMSVCFGYSMGISPIISYNYGKRETARLQRIFAISLKLIGLVSCCVFVFCNVAAAELVGLFVDRGTHVFEMAYKGLHLFSCTFLFMGMNVFASALFTALSNGKVSAFLSFCRTFVFVIGFLLILPLFWQMTGVWISTPCAEALSFAVSLACFKKYGKVYRYV